MLRWSIWLHKWIALIVGLQVLAWVGGGLVMTAIPIGKVRGELNARPVANPPLAVGEVMPLAAVIETTGFKDVEHATVKNTPQGPIWVLVSIRGSEAYFDGRTGGDVREITPEEATKSAASAFGGEGKPVRTQYLEDAPEEADARPPLYAVDFDDKEKSRLYLDTFTGEVLSRRSDTWRFYDFFWRLHAMDWKTGNDFNHPLIIVTTAVTLIVVLTGFVLLWIRIARDLKVARDRRAAKTSQAP